MPLYLYGALGIDIQLSTEGQRCGRSHVDDAQQKRSSPAKRRLVTEIDVQQTTLLQPLAGRSFNLELWLLGLPWLLWVFFCVISHLSW